MEVHPSLEGQGSDCAVRYCPYVVFGTVVRWCIREPRVDTKYDDQKCGYSDILKSILVILNNDIRSIFKLLCKVKHYIYSTNRLLQIGHEVTDNMKWRIPRTK